MSPANGRSQITVGVLALQGSFSEHTQTLKKAAASLASNDQVPVLWAFLEVRTAAELDRCDALIIPGGESTAMSLVAERSGLLEFLRSFVKVSRKPTWGTCAGLILLAETANRTKQGGQELVGGLDVRVNRNYFGRQIESFQADLNIPFLHEHDGVRGDAPEVPYPGIFIRSPIVEEVLPAIQEDEAKRDAIVVAPSRPAGLGVDPKLRDVPVEILARLPGRAAMLKDGRTRENLDEKVSDIIAVRQANVFGTCFHPELTGDPRIHIWWLKQVVEAVEAVEKMDAKS